MAVLIFKLRFVASPTIRASGNFERPWAPAQQPALQKVAVAIRAIGLLPIAKGVDRVHT
jgi:hypothetical protein